MFTYITQMAATCHCCDVSDERLIERAAMVEPTLPCRFGCEKCDVKCTFESSWKGEEALVRRQRDTTFYVLRDGKYVAYYAYRDGKSYFL